MSLKHILAISLLALSAFGAAAHQIWIEPAGKAYAVRFGEYDENLKETSPGLLDKMPVPVVSAYAGAEVTAVAVRKESDGFAVRRPERAVAVLAAGEFARFDRIERAQP